MPIKRRKFLPKKPQSIVTAKRSISKKRRERKPPPSYKRKERKATAGKSAKENQPITSSEPVAAKEAAKEDLSAKEKQ
jgi:hypothetical protein